MPSHVNCCVPGCTNQKKFCKWGLFPNGQGQFTKRRLCGTDGKGGCRNSAGVCKGLSFHRLPADKHLRSDWLVKIRRINTPLTANTYVCGVHFEGGRRKGVTSSPTIFSWSAQAKARTTRVSAAATDLSHLVDKEKDERHPSSNVGDCRVPSVASDPDADDSDTDVIDSVSASPPSACSTEDLLVNHWREQVEFLQNEYIKVSRELVEEKSRVVSLTYEINKAKEEISRLQDTVAKQSLSYSRLKGNSELLKFYTGLDTEAIDFLLMIAGESRQEACRHTVFNTDNFQGLDKRGRKRILKPEDELILTLCKLRHNFPEGDLALRFGVHQSTVSRIVSCWTEILEACIDEFPLWPDKDVIQRHMPAVFKEQFPKTRVIIDAAEIEIDRPRNPDTQSQTWSEYKSRNTIKFLLAVTPNGVPCFVSQCFGGRISDKELTQRCGILDKTSDGKERFDPGDAIMADKGFDIDDLLQSQAIQLNHPPFLKGKEQFTEEEVIRTRRIASLRVHVERAIERIKNFRILDHIFVNMHPVASRLVKVCTFLTVLMPPFVPAAAAACDIMDVDDP